MTFSARRSTATSRTIRAARTRRAATGSMTPRCGRSGVSPAPSFRSSAIAARLSAAELPARASLCAVAASCGGHGPRRPAISRARPGSSTPMQASRRIASNTANQRSAASRSGHCSSSGSGSTLKLPKRVCAHNSAAMALYRRRLPSVSGARSMRSGSHRVSVSVQARGPLTSLSGRPSSACRKRDRRRSTAAKATAPCGCCERTRFAAASSFSVRRVAARPLRS